MRSGPGSWPFLIVPSLTPSTFVNNTNQNKNTIQKQTLRKIKLPFFKVIVIKKKQNNHFKKWVCILTTLKLPDLKVQKTQGILCVADKKILYITQTFVK